MNLCWSGLSSDLQQFVLIDVQAYESTQQAPNTTKPHPIVQVKLIPINADFGVPLCEFATAPRPARMTRS